MASEKRIRDENPSTLINFFRLDPNRVIDFPKVGIKYPGFTNNPKIPIIILDINFLNFM